MSETPKNEEPVILYSLEDCAACDELKKKPPIAEAIEAGKIIVKECTLDKDNPENLAVCEEATKREGFDGFPSIYQGKKKLF